MGFTVKHVRNKRSEEWFDAERIDGDEMYAGGDREGRSVEAFDPNQGSPLSNAEIESAAGNNDDVTAEGADREARSAANEEGDKAGDETSRDEFYGAVGDLGVDGSSDRLERSAKQGNRFLLPLCVRGYIPSGL